MKTTRKSGMDMLHGSMLDKILLFALPLALGSILQQLFNSVDVAVVGRFASSQALAAVGANAPVVALLLTLFVGISVGSNVVIAKYIGQNQPERIQWVVDTSMVVAVASGLFLMVLGMAIATPLLRLMSTPEDVLELAEVYLRIYCLGMPFIMVYNFGAAILRSVGDTRRPLYCLITAGVINAGLNVFFVVVCRMSVSGVAIATDISNVVSTMMVVYFLLHAEEPIRLHPRSIRVHQEELLHILKIGIPAGLQGMVFSVANVTVQSAINGFGSKVVAGSAVALNFEYITYYAINGFNSAVMTFTSQNYGAGDARRCKRAYAISMACAVIACAGFDLFFFAGRGFFIALFTEDAAVAAYAVERMKYVLLAQCLACSYEISGSALRGFGYSLTPALLTVFGTCVIRILWVHTVNVRVHTFFALLLVYPFSWVITGILVVSAYFIIRNRELKRLQREEEIS